MYCSRVVPSNHKDLIHDVAFNWYGTHLATCSSDQTVKIWAWDPEKQTWSVTASWKSHSGSVWKVTWAHPEFGQVLATCSFDRTACVWEEMPGDSHLLLSSGGGGSSQGGVHASSANNSGHPSGTRNMSAQAKLDANLSHWVKRTSLVDSRTSVTDIKFAPKHMGLMLATCSADGIVRIYEALDIMNLSSWTLQHEIPVKISCSCLAWNSTFNRSQPPMLAVGSDDPVHNNGGKVFIYEYNETLRRWLRVETLTSITESVHDISFAPNIGRSYSVLGIGTKDLRIVTLKPVAVTETLVTTEGGSSVGGQASQTTTPAVPGAPQHANVTKYEVKLAGQFNDHNSTVWRVCWNVTGTILASSGDDGKVKLWKSNYKDNWKCVATLKAGSASTGSTDAALTMTGPGAAFNSSSNNANSSRGFQPQPPGLALAASGNQQLWQ